MTMTVTNRLQSNEAGPPAYQQEPFDISAAFSNLSLTNVTEFPKPDECIAHLKLLDAFYQLKEEIVERDGLFGLENSKILEGTPEKQREEVLRQVRDKRWQIYVSKAVGRFEIWFEKQILPDARMYDMNDIGFKRHSHATADRKFVMTRERLPPVDVLMVWHSFLLNPRTYLSDCIRYGKMSFWTMGLPLSAINEAIDNYTLNYDPGESAQRNWTASTTSPWDCLDESDTIAVTCYHCSRIIQHPWTTYKSANQFLSEAERHDYGYADQNFLVSCRCGHQTDHELLKVMKFRRDLGKLLVDHIPMPGGYLNIDGILCSWKDNLSMNGCLQDMIFPSRLLREGGLATAFRDTNYPDVRTVQQIKSKFEQALSGDFKYVKKLRTHGSVMIRRGERVAVRKMMACYWDTSSIFSMDLVGAVLRQGNFVEKMHNIDWLHSPALQSSMSRLIEKYRRFFIIMSKYPTEVAVPTLDVDLAWHTHQLAALSYYRYSTSHTDQKRPVFIDHDDKIPEGTLSTAFEWTCKTYQDLFDSIYSECTCWYCEAIRESSNGTFKSLFASSKNQSKQELRALHKLTTSSDPQKAPHISAHNAISARDQGDMQLLAEIHVRKLERGYTRAATKARRARRPVPERYTDQGHAHLPYMAYPFVLPLYVAAPACGTFADGQAGNCCQGTCGGSVAMGSCIGSAGGSCGGSGLGSSAVCAAPSASGGFSGGGGGSGGGDSGGCGGGGGGCGGGGGG